MQTEKRSLRTNYQAARLRLKTYVSIRSLYYWLRKQHKRLFAIQVVKACAFRVTWMFLGLLRYQDFNISLEMINYIASVTA